MARTVDDEIIKHAHEKDAPVPLKMAAMEIGRSRGIRAVLGGSSLSIEAHPEYRESRRRVDYWLALWRGDTEAAAKLGPAADLNATDDLDGAALPIGRIFWAGAIFGAPVIYLVMAWWRWWLS